MTTKLPLIQSSLQALAGNPYTPALLIMTLEDRRTIMLGKTWVQLLCFNNKEIGDQRWWDIITLMSRF